MPQEYLSVSELAEFLGVCKKSIYRYIAAKMFPAVLRETHGGREYLKVSMQSARTFVQLYGDPAQRGGKQAYNRRPKPKQRKKRKQ